MLDDLLAYHFNHMTSVDKSLFDKLNEHVMDDGSDEGEGGGRSRNEGSEFDEQEEEALQRQIFLA